ncbi:hypothetical protein [Stutzerimonas nitrititolerans]|uniref:hypothetical protein n=1 Tax=Stutzerimonas nitrititolerans TaxID=2482751 RepID=UPI00289F3DEB|nr:hypothetical protein [Stutzerimonas nitrititolerans]
MIKLPGNETRYVAADQITCVELSYHRTRIAVTLRDGKVYHFEPDCGDAIYQAVNKFVTTVNEALEATNG